MKEKLVLMVENLNNNPNYSRNLGIETIYQDLALADNLDVPSNIFLGREPIKKSLKFLHRLDRILCINNP